MKLNWLLKIGLASLGAVLLHGSSFAGDLSICIDKSSPTSKLDRSVASAIAQAENRTLNVYAFDSNDDEDGMSAADFSRLLAHDCSFVLGYPSGVSAAPLPSGLATTEAYGKTAYVLATTKDISAARLDDLPDGTEVAVTDGTITDLILANHQKLKANVLASEPLTLKALTSGTDKAALLWRPIIDSAAAAKFDIEPLDIPHASWNLTALYASANADAAKAFNAALDRLKKSNALVDILAPFGIEEVSAAEANPSLIAAAARPSAVADASGPPALYTEAQATRGLLKFMGNCAQCHGGDLRGVTGPALVGRNFASAKDSFTVANIFLIVSHNMPAMQPGSLTRDEYRDIMAFLLKQNGYPSGPTELQYDAALKSSVPFVYRGR